MLFDFLDFLAQALYWFCFLLPGFALGHFTLNAYAKAGWQVQVALVLGFFLLLTGVANYTPDSLASAFFLGAGLAFLRDFLGKEGKT